MHYVTENSTKASLLESERVWWGENGPHQKWSWEIHLIDERALARAVLFLMANKISINSTLFHPRTKDIHERNEYHDHAHRLTWIGEPDPDPLHVDFFKSWP
jgi:aromatic ring-cleaving dioxygenase